MPFSEGAKPSGPFLLTQLDLLPIVPLSSSRVSAAPSSLPGVASITGMPSWEQEPAVKVLLGPCDGTG